MRINVTIYDLRDAVNISCKCARVPIGEDYLIPKLLYGNGAEGLNIWRMELLHNPRQFVIADEQLTWLYLAQFHHKDPRHYACLSEI